MEPRESPEAQAREEADFGFRRVPAGAKKRLVREVFDTVATRYDVMNDMMSAGVHRLWKDAMVDWLSPRPGQTILDVAGGTGDVAFRVAERTKGKSSAVVCDANEQMVRIGRDRALDRGMLAGIDWLVGDAQALPLAGGRADAYTIAFGLRNVTDIDAALREAKRVLKPGGRFLCLEFSRVTVPLLDDLYSRFSFSVIPWIGEKVTGSRESYRYLVESIRRFPPQHALAERIERAGLGQVRVRNLSGGIAALHSAWRL
jgi:demethylmenaquinone methyltransferase / 2-methoxy-6-polyprenyl-1,4-benzoquinol methylase